jgi:hypothetical protein
MVIGEVIPGVSALAVALADGSPLTFAQISPYFFQGIFLSRDTFSLCSSSCNLVSSLGMNGAQSEAELIRGSRVAQKKPWPLGQGNSFEATQKPLVLF